MRWFEGIRAFLGVKGLGEAGKGVWRFWNRTRLEGFTLASLYLLWYLFLVRVIVVRQEPGV